MICLRRDSTVEKVERIKSTTLREDRADDCAESDVANTEF